MSTLYRFDFLQTAEVLAHRVYLRGEWGDDWAIDNSFHCESATWAANPTIPTATLTRRYGWVVEPDSYAAENRGRESPLNRSFVKIEFDTVSLLGLDSPAVLKWYGVLEIDTNIVDGSLTKAAEDYLTGRQHFQCYGLAQLLDRIVVGNSATETATAGTEQRLGRGLDFNFGGNQNRSTAAGSLGSFVFSKAIKHADAHWWSTKDAVNYLLAYHGPRSNTGTVVLPFEVSDPNTALPDWDHVALPTEGQTVWELLNALMSRQRLLGFAIEPSLDETKIQIKPFTFATADITLPGISGTIKKNPAQIEIACERAADCSLVVKDTSLDIFDQVECRGALRTSCCTLSFVDQNIAKGWKASLETEYYVAASSAVDYPPATEIEERQWRNFEARKASKFKSVYSYFVVVDTWNGKAGDGVSGPDQTMACVFPDDLDSTKNVPFYLPELFVLPRLSLMDGLDYSGGNIAGSTVTELSDGPHERLNPIVLFPRHDSAISPTDKWKMVDDIGLGSELEIYGTGDFALWSARVEVPENARGVLVRVQNGFQHVIAKTDFVPLPEDPQFFTNDNSNNPNTNDYYAAVFTLCFEWDWHTVGKWPATTDVAQDELRVLTLNFGDTFRCDYVVPKTIVGVDPKSGAALRSSTGGFIRDDRGLLEAIARMCFEWYATVRKAVEFGTSRVNSDLFIGQLLLAVGDPEIEGDTRIEDINSVITFIQIEIPYEEGEAAIEVPPARMTYETSFGELDEVKYLSSLTPRD